MSKWRRLGMLRPGNLSRYLRVGKQRLLAVILVGLEMYVFEWHGCETSQDLLQ